MKRVTSSLIIGLGLVLYSFGLIAPLLKVSAQDTPGNGQALEIAPPVITLSGNPGETVKTEINLRNISGNNLLVKAQANDFVAAGEDGTPKLLLDEEAENNPYSLKDWVVPLGELLLVPRQIEALPATIKIPSDASPGGHYGVIRFTATPPELEDTGVALSASLGSLLLITVNGATTQSMKIEEFSVNRNGKTGTLFESAPLNFVTRFNNTGNIHVLPAGQITVTDMFGKKIATVNVNLPPRNILPQSIRRFEQPLDKSVMGNKRLFGRYKATLNVTYGDSKQTVTQTIQFWVIPYRAVFLAIMLLVLGFFVLRFMIRRYNNRIINRSRRHR